jgi:hypothetical protein
MFVGFGRIRAGRSGPGGPTYNYSGTPADNYLGRRSRACRIYNGYNSFPKFSIQENWGNAHQARQGEVLAAVSTACRMINKSYLIMAQWVQGSKYCG